MSRMLLFLAAIILAGRVAAAAPLHVSLAPAPNNPPAPKMGDHMVFTSVLENRGSTPAEGVVAWISLVQVDPGREQPMDLEDWSAHKAVTQAMLAPGERIAVDWPMRLIQSGRYRVLITAVERNTSQAVTSPFLDIEIRSKPVVESKRILPIALGVPLVFVVLLGVSVRRRRA